MSLSAFGPANVTILSSGTGAACPHVAGAVAGIDRNMSYTELKNMVSARLTQFEVVIEP